MMEILDMERREPRAMAPAAADTEVARRAVPDNVPFSPEERRRLRDALMHSHPVDEARRMELVGAIERLRETIAGLLKHESTVTSVSKLALPSTLVESVAHPAHVRIKPDSLSEIWRQVGGYLGESIDKVRSGSHDD